MILENISRIYDAFYQDLPSTQIGIQQQTMHQQLSDYINKLQLFIKNIVSNSPSLMTDLNFYENKINLLKKGENFMVNFYNIENKYRQLKLQTKYSNDHKDDWEKFKDYTKRYDKQVDLLQEKSVQLYRFNGYLATSIRQLQKSTSTGNVMNSFDSIIHFSARLIEIKDSLQRAIYELKQMLQEFQPLQTDIVTSLGVISGEVDE